MRLKDLEAAIDLRGRLAEAEKLRADVSGYTERMTIEPFGIDLPGDFDPPSRPIGACYRAVRGALVTLADSQIAALRKELADMGVEVEP